MWPNPQETADLVTFTEEILNAKMYFLCSVSRRIFPLSLQNLFVLHKNVLANCKLVKLKAVIIKIMPDDLFDSF